jgi:hypothetical protein
MQKVVANVRPNRQSSAGEVAKVAAQIRTVMMLKTVDEACDFVAEWCQEKGAYAGKILSAGFAVPDCIVRLNARIGHLWHRARRRISEAYSAKSISTPRYLLETLDQPLALEAGQPLDPEQAV